MAYYAQNLSMMKRKNMAIIPLTPALFLFFSQVMVSCSATVFTLQNKCPFTIWPVTLSASSNSPLPGATGLSDLPSNSTTTLPAAPPGWSGRIWARTGCLFTTSRTTCTTGESPPFTLAEFSLSQDDQDSYDVSLLQGYNVGIGVTASIKECKYAGCTEDMNARCPAELRVEGAGGETAGCKTACQVFGAEEYCCTGKHSTPATCGQTRYSQLFKAACPVAYCYAYDDQANTCTCASGSDYLVTFCPSNP